MKPTTTEYHAITLDSIERAGRAAAFVAIRKAYHGTIRKVKDKDGELLQYDGNSGGTDLMRRLYYGFSGTMAAKKERLDRAVKAYYEALDDLTDTVKEELDTLNDAMTTFADETGNDTDDCINVAVLSIWENIVHNGGKEATEGAFMDAVRAVHRYMYGEDNNIAVRVRREYDKDGNRLSETEYKYTKYPHMYIDACCLDNETSPYTQLVDVNDGISRLVKGWTDNETIKAVIDAVKPTTAQKQILQYVALGYTYETISRRLNMNVSTIKTNIKRFRDKANKMRKEGKI